MVIPVVLTMWFLIILSPELDAQQVHGGPKNPTVFQSEDECLAFGKKLFEEIKEKFPNHSFALKCEQDPRLERYVEQNTI